MKRFFRRAGCAPPDDSRRRGAALCHLAGAHRVPASDLKGLDPHCMLVRNPEGRTSGVSLRKGRA